MTPPAKTLMGSKINYFQGSIALCHTGSIARGFSIIIKKFETLHRPCHWPTICYGHVVQRGERFAKRQYTEREADALLRHDLNKMLSFFDGFRKSDALLLAVLSYNIGPGAVQKSTVYKKLKSGDRNIFKAYTSHCRYKGKFHKGLHNRRLTELAALFIP